VAVICMIIPFLFFTIAAPAAELVVVESSNTALTPGTVLSGPIILSSGESVTLMDGMGTLYRQAGPFDGSVAAPEAESGASTIKALSRLLADNATDTTTLGAIRNFPGQGTDDLTLVAGEMAGDQCVVSTPQLGLWRASADRPETASLRLVGGADSNVSWVKGEAVAPWPDALPVENGGVYLLRRPGTSIPYKIVLHVIPQAPNLGDRIALMDGAGCTAQARAALSMLINGGSF